MGSLFLTSIFDHCKAHKEIAKAGIDLYMLRDTADAIGSQGHRTNIIEPLKQFTVGDFTILPFPVEHDVPAIGFLIQSKSTNEKCVYITDSYYVRYKFTACTHMMLECNYSEELLLENINNNSTNQYLRNRIQRSHFSLNHLKEFLLANDLSKVQTIYLMHLSNSNANEVQIRREIQELTGKLVVVC